MTNQPTVWIVNDAGHDFSKAEKHGQLKCLTVGRINPFYPDRLAVDLAQGVVKYATEDDFLLLSGTPILTGLAMHLWLKVHRQCKILQWNAKHQDYELSTVTDDNLSRIADEALFS